MAEVEIGLGAVVGDEDLAVLERAHRAGVDVDVRVELLQRDAEAARLEQRADRCRGDALAETGNTTPPVTKMYFVLIGRPYVGNAECKIQNAKRGHVRRFCILNSEC